MTNRELDRRNMARRCELSLRLADHNAKKAATAQTTAAPKPKTNRLIAAAEALAVERLGALRDAVHEAGKIESKGKN